MRLFSLLFLASLISLPAYAGQISNLNDYTVTIWVSETGSKQQKITIPAMRSWQFYSPVIDASTAEGATGTRMQVEHQWSVKDGEFTLQRRNQRRIDD